MNLKVKIILSAFISILISLPAYIVLHEGGHALVAAFCGAHITKFSVLGAYMSFEGGAFTSTTLALMNIGGMLLPVLVAIVYMLSYRKKGTSMPYKIFSFLFLLIPIGSILAWVIVPIMYLAEKAPQNDDVTKFINNSGLSPWVVLSAASILFACCFFLAWKKKIIQNYWAAVSMKK